MSAEALVVGSVPRRRRLRLRRLGMGVAFGATSVLGMFPAVATPGDLDVTFGVDGVLRTNLGGSYDWAYAVAVQPDGRILAAGVSDALGTYDFALARYTSTQQLDPTFGNGGVVTTDFGNSSDWAYALALQPDGKIVLGGMSTASGSKDFALARYNGDGSLDPTFGEGGLVTYAIRRTTTDIIHGIAVQPDGKIVAAGVTFEDSVSLRPHGDFMAARFLPNGSFDPTFGIAGIVTTNFGQESYDEPYAVVLQPDGRIVLAGYTNSGGGPGVLFGADQLGFTRYTPEGLLDLAFGNGGKVVIDGGTMDEEIRALALLSDGDIVAAGFVNGEKRGDLLLVRLEPNGALDVGFGDTGAGFTVSDLGTHSERLESVVVQPDGKIVAGGQAATGDDPDFAVVRYDRGGLLDPSFGSGGVATVDFQSRDDRVRAIALQSDGKIVAAGQSEADFALARFNVS